MRQGDGANPALGQKRFSDIVDTVNIEIRLISDERVRKARLGEKRGFPFGKFEGAVRSEMNEEVGVKSVSRPKIRGDVEVRRRFAGPVHGVELVPLLGIGIGEEHVGRRLRNENDVSKPHARND